MNINGNINRTNVNFGSSYWNGTEPVNQDNILTISASKDYGEEGRGAGRIGINNIEPKQSLDVNGKIKVSEICIGNQCINEDKLKKIVEKYKS